MGRLLVVGLAAAVLIFNFGVLFVVFLTSLSDTNFIRFPPDGLTLRHYGGLAAYRSSILYSFQTAVFAASLSAALGTLAAVALVRSNLRFRRALLNFFLSPLIIPSSVFGLAVLVLLVRSGWRPGFWPLSLALAVNGAPFCIRIIASGLQNIDWQLEAAARTLGASRRRAWLRVILPLAAPSIAGGWTFSFIFAFDDSTISIFLASVRRQTYGAQLIAELDDFLTPRIAAAGTAIIGITIAGVGLLLLIVWLQRRYIGSAAAAVFDEDSEPIEPELLG